MSSPGDLAELQKLLDQSQVSTASLTTESASTAPATIVTITSEDLRTYGIQTLAEALNFLSLGFVTEKRLDYSEIGVRGVTFAGDYGAHVLYLLDGHALNEQWDGAAYFDQQMGIPLEQIDHIEIILGPGSVLYGSNAMLGVINVVTKNGRTLDGGYATLESQLGASARASVGYGREFTAFGTRGDASFGVMALRQVGPYATLGPQDYGADAVTGEPRRFTSSADGTGVWGGTIRSGRFTNVLGGNGKVTLGDFTLDAHASSAQRGTPVSVYGNYDDPGNWERDTWVSGDLRWSRSLTRLVMLDMRLYGDRYTYYQQLTTRAAENCLGEQDEGCTYRLGGEARWVGLDTHATLDWLPNGAITTVVGADGRARGIGSWEDYVDYDTAESVVTGDYTLGEQAVGAYLENVVRAGDTLGLNAGVRVDADTRYGTHTSPRAVVALYPSDGTILKLMYSEAFRAPTAFERYYSDPTWWVEANELRPEDVRSVELAVEQQLGDQRILGALFGTQWSDMVTDVYLTPDEIDEQIAAGVLEAGTSEAHQYQNLGASRNYGLNLAWDGTAAERRVRYGATLTVADWVERTDDGYDAPGTRPVAPKWYGNAHLAYSPGGDWPTIAVAARTIGKRPIDYSEFDPYPDAPAKADLNVTLSGAVPKTPSLTWRLSAMGTTSTETPFSVGPLAAPADGYTAQETAPVDAFTLLAGLSYRPSRASVSPSSPATGP